MMKRILTLLTAFCLSLYTFAQIAGDEEAVKKAKTMYELSIDKGQQQRYKEAAALANRSYSIYDSLVMAHRDSMLYVAPRARLCLQLSQLYYLLNDGGRCLRTAQRSLRFYNVAMELDPEAYADEMEEASANLYIYTAYGYQENKQDDEALQNVEKALEIRNKLFAENREDNLRGMFTCYRVKGMVLIHLRQFAEAHKTLNEAIKILDECEKLWPGTNSFNYQTVYFNIASAYYSDGKYDDALAGNMKVLDLILNDKNQTKANQYYYLDYVYKYIGNCYWCLAWECFEKNNKNKKCKEMKSLYQKAIDSYNMSLQYNASDYESLSKLSVCNMILLGMEKPRPMMSTPRQ